MIPHNLYYLFWETPGGRHDILCVSHTSYNHNSCSPTSPVCLYLCFQYRLKYAKSSYEIWTSFPGSLWFPLALCACSGGSILSTRCSETYETKTALMSLFGLPLWYFSQSPRVVIQVSLTMREMPIYWLHKVGYRIFALFLLYFFVLMAVFKQREWIRVDSGLVESMMAIWFHILGCNFMIRLSLHVGVILVKKVPLPVTEFGKLILI